MQSSALPRAKLVRLAAVAALLAAALWVWLKTPYSQPQPRQVAVAFLTQLQAGDFAAAHALTVKSGYVGRTPQELAQLSQSARFCPDSYAFNYTHPTQTQGNRLRRWLAGRDIEMSEVLVDFSCLQADGQLAGLWGAKLRRAADGVWRVTQFGLHAG
jgi:hypothetical protein